MMTTPNSIEELIVAEVSASAYHPRTSKHSDAQSLLIIRDLLAACPILAARAATGELVGKLRHHQQVGHGDWVIDIALGTPPGPPAAPDDGQVIRFTEPTLIQIAIELKSIWTEHGKARKNRLRDFEAFHNHAHDYAKDAIAAAFLLVNASEIFLSPLNLDKSRRDAITQHRRKEKTTGHLIKETIDVFRSIHLRSKEADPPGLEAIGVVVIEHDNLNYLDGKQEYSAIAEKCADLRKPSRVASVPPALKVGDPLHYRTMIQRICNFYRERFS